MIDRHYRIGYGEDIHRLVEGRPLVLCALPIPYSKGLLGHSDADCALHAVADAILGALALGDIGRYFPDTDPRWTNVASRYILEDVVDMMGDQGYQVENVDVTLFAEEPKLAPYILAMRQKLASLLHIELDQASVKAKTNEGLDAVGQSLAIRATALVLLKSQSSPKMR